MIKIYRIKDNVYGAYPFLCIGSWSDFKMYMYCFEVDVKQETASAMNFAFEYEDSDNFCIWLKSFKETNIISMGHLVHECMHATVAILNSRGIPINKNNEECVAYYQEFLFKGFLSKIRNKNFTVP